MSTNMLPSVVCPLCGGSGDSGTPESRCPLCNGEGDLTDLNMAPWFSAIHAHDQRIQYDISILFGELANITIQLQIMNLLKNEELGGDGIRGAHERLMDRNHNPRPWIADALGMEVES